MRRIAVTVVAGILALSGCGAPRREIQSYVLTYYDAYVGGIRGSITYTVEGDQVREVRRDESERTVEESRDTLTAKQRERASQLVSAALEDEQAEACTDVAYYDLSVTDGDGQTTQHRFTPCPGDDNPLSDLREILGD